MKKEFFKNVISLVVANILCVFGVLLLTEAMRCSVPENMNLLVGLAYIALGGICMFVGIASFCSLANSLNRIIGIVDEDNNVAFAAAIALELLVIAAWNMYSGAWQQALGLSVAGVVLLACCAWAVSVDKSNKVALG